MASETETMADIVREMVEFGNHCAAFGGAYSPERWDNLCKRLNAAHKREIAAKDAEIAELRETINLDSVSMAGKDAVIEELRAKLKAAEDALDFAWMYADKLPHQWPLPERVRTKMRNALDAIREEGGESK